MGEAVRRHRFALLLIAILVVILFLPAIVKREVFTLRDHTDYFQPLRYFTAIHLRYFVLPYWNPYSASGEPWLANPQTGVFYPPTWLFIRLPFESAYMLYLAIHLLILGWGSYLLFARSVSEGAALVGAVAITFCGPTLSLLDISNNLATFAWIPLVIWSAAARASPQLAALLLAMAFLGGEPFFAAIGAALYVIVRAFSPAPAGEKVAVGRMRGAATDILIAALGAFGLSAIQLIPFVELIRGSNRAARLPSAEIFRESMAPGDWLKVAIPPRLDSGGFDRALSQHFIPMIYVGIAIAGLAIAAWVFVRKREVIGWTLLLAASIVVASGPHLLIGRLFETAPVTLFRYPSRVIPFGALALVALAVLAWDRFRPKKRWADLLLVAILLVDVLPRAAPLLRTARFQTDAVPYPAAVGRRAKMIRLNSGPLVDRQAWIAGYVNLYQRQFDASSPAPLITERYARLLDASLAEGRLDLLGFLGAGFVLSDRAIFPPLQPVAKVRGVTLNVNPEPQHMATVWTWWRPARTPDEALDALLKRGTASGVWISGAGAPAADPARSHPIEIESLIIDTRHARAVVDAPEDAVFSITQQDAPGWRVFVDGVEKKKLLAAGVFRAVAVPKGRHEVIWRWNPSSLRVGMVITLFTALALQTTSFVKRFKRRKFSS